MSTTRSKAIAASYWTVLGFGTAQVLRLGGNIVLAAVLFEEAFALMAIVGAVMQGLAMFSDLGLGPSVVQNKRGDDPSFLNTAWTMQIVRGVFLTAVAVLAAAPVAAFYSQNDPSANELQWLLPLAAMSTFISGFASSKLWTTQRHMNLAAPTLIELASQASGLAAMVSIALATQSVYALPLGGLVSALCTCALSHAALPGPRNRLQIDKAAFFEIFSFGKWIFLSTVVSFLALQIDKLMFARMFPLSDVGVYAVAASLAIMVPALLGRLHQMVAFPLYAKLASENKPIEEIVERTKLPLLALGSLLVVVVVACSQTFVDIAYDDRYHAAGLYLAILGVGSWFALVDGIYGAAFLSVGKASWVALVNTVKVLSFCIILFPAAKAWGFLGAVIAMAASDAVKLVVAYSLAHGAGLRRRGLDLLFLALSVATVLATHLASGLFAPENRLENAFLLVFQASLVLLLFSLPLFSAYRSLLSNESHRSQPSPRYDAPD
jgi:O-antigen/teichoic acid export membrane protein